MRAAVHRRYGPPDVLELDEIEQPRPGDHDVLVRIRYTTVNRTDAGFLRAKPFVTRFFSGLLRPRHATLGCEFAGDVEAIGAKVTRFAKGDRVFGFDDVGWGGHAQYKVIAQDRAIAAIPPGVSYEQAAASTEGAHYALCYIRAARVRAGTRVLVHGATGAIGSAAVQLLKHAGALGLLQSLVQAGAMTGEQATGLQMMIAMFARPGEGDSLTSTIVTEPGGGLTVNGTRLR